jgi:hypothetical protein
MRHAENCSERPNYLSFTICVSFSAHMYRINYSIPEFTLLFYTLQMRKTVLKGNGVWDRRFGTLTVPFRLRSQRMIFLQDLLLSYVCYFYYVYLIGKE